MELSLWTYPWDVLDLGLHTLQADLAHAGVNGVSIASSYHAGRFFQPRSPVRRAYFPQDGKIYFHPSPERWQNLRIQPEIAEIVTQRGDVLRDLIALRERSGLAVKCWTVCLHNTRLGLLHPGACTRNAFGDPAYYSLCPSNPDVRAYAITLVADLTERYRPDVVELETPGFMGFAHGFHHEKDGVGLAPEDDFLLSLCFCPSCLQRAARAGVDGEAARRTVRHWIEALSEQAIPRPRFPDFAARGQAVFAEHPEVLAYVHWRFEPVTSLVAAIREQAHQATRVQVIDVDDGWLSGSDLAALGRVCDGIVLCVYDRSPDAVGAAIRRVRGLLDTDVYLGAGLRVFTPELAGAQDLVERAVAARDAGAAGINFYNYGLIPAARLDWIRAASDAVRATETIQ